MIRKRRSLPNPNDLVVCTITKVFSHGAFANLDEYEGQTGFIHVSEIASTWIKNIRDFVKEGQKTVAKVLRVDPQKGHVDISTRRVNDAQKKSKMLEWKRAQKTDKLLEIAAKKAGKSLDEAYSEVGFKLEEKYGEIYSGLEELSVSGEKALAGLDIPKSWASPLMDVVKENISFSLAEVSGYVDLTSTAPNGIELIKKALIRARDERAAGDTTLEIRYIGSPRYKIKVIAQDYKTAEEILKKSANTAIAAIEESGGVGKFLRDIKEEK